MKPQSESKKQQRWTLFQLHQSLGHDLAACHTDLERSNCRAIGGKHIREEAELIATERSLTDHELAIARLYGYQQKQHDPKQEFTMDQKLPHAQQLQIFGDGEVPRAGELGYVIGKVVDGTEEDIRTQFVGDYIAVPSATVFGQSGVYEWAIMAKPESDAHMKLQQDRDSMVLGPQMRAAPDDLWQRLTEPAKPEKFGDFNKTVRRLNRPYYRVTEADYKQFVERSPDSDAMLFDDSHLVTFGEADGGWAMMPLDAPLVLEQKVQQDHELTMQLVSSGHGYDDYDVTGHPDVHRACVPHGIKKGQTFNVYCREGAKAGAIWAGDLTASLNAFELPDRELLQSKAATLLVDGAPVESGMRLQHSEYGQVEVRHSPERGWHYLRWGYGSFGTDFENLSNPETRKLRQVQSGRPSIGDADATRALGLRAQAQALLEQAHAIDGLQPYIVMHEHKTGTSGTSAYLAWADHALNEEEASVVLDSEFEPDRQEVLTIEDSVSLSELTGVATSARPADILSAELDDVSPSPSMGM